MATNHRVVDLLDEDSVAAGVGFWEMLTDGPEYLLAGNLARLKNRSLNKKRILALNEFALGMESLDRFVRRDPLYRVHECVFGVLAMESEPVDPRL